MLTIKTHRPRNVDAARAGALLYGDWGSSKAYVIGLAFAVAGYMSFWLILAVSILSLLVGINYITICKYYPNGGGVYASVRDRSKALSIIGALFLVADYLVTAALSALSAFYYFGAPDPVLFAALFMLIAGAFNYFGPRHSGTFAYIIVIAAVTVFTLLALSSLPFLKTAWENIVPLSGKPLPLWAQFCSVIVALSGVETIANTTGIMKLNKGATLQNPQVTRTSTPAIISVMIEVVIYTTLFGFAAAAIGNFVIIGDNVTLPGAHDVRDYMLRYLGMYFGTSLFGSTVGHIFAIIISVVVGFILLSAVNTAMNGLIALQYIMADDEELPRHFRKTNRFGVPFLPLIIATIIPMALILFAQDVVYLAELYAIGFVGAIATNLGSTSTNFKLSLLKRERIFMFFVFLIMAAIEITLFIDKSHARYFAIYVMVSGVALRYIAVKLRKRKEEAPSLAKEPPKETILCILRRYSKALEVAVEESKEKKRPLTILFVREQRVISDKDLLRSGARDPNAKKVMEYLNEKGDPNLIHFQYCVTDSFVDIAIAYMIRLEAKEVIIDPPRSKLLTLIRGNYLTYLKEQLPSGVSLRVYSKKHNKTPLFEQKT